MGVGGEGNWKKFNDLLFLRFFVQLFMIFQWFIIFFNFLKLFIIFSIIPHFKWELFLFFFSIFRHSNQFRTKNILEVLQGEREREKLHLYVKKVGVT